MKIEIKEHCLTVTREPGDTKMRGGSWGSDESQLLHQIKNILNAQGNDFIKKLIQKDGHMMGDKYMHYLRTRNRRSEGMSAMIYDGEYAIRDSAEDFNAGKTVVFLIERDIWKK